MNIKRIKNLVKSRIIQIENKKIAYNYNILINLRSLCNGKNLRIN